MIKIISFEENQVGTFKAKGKFLDLKKDLIAAFKDPKVDMLTLIEEATKKVICFAGLNHIRPGVGEVWIIPGVLINSNRLKFCKIMNQLIANCHVKMGMHRLELAIDLDLPEGHRWAKYLGFLPQGICELYDNTGADCMIYASLYRRALWQQEQ